eukprot:scaffold3882_cov164-Amphora_coffeaeformis.AAC.17
MERQREEALQREHARRKRLQEEEQARQEEIQRSRMTRPETPNQMWKNAGAQDQVQSGGCRRGQRSQAQPKRWRGVDIGQRRKRRNKIPVQFLGDPESQ